MELDPSERKTFEISDPADLRITNAALDPVLKDETGRTTVVLYITGPSFDESESEEEDSEESPPQKLVLTSLTPGKVRDAQTCLFSY